MKTRFFIAFSVTIIGLVTLLLAMYQLGINYWWAAINTFFVAILLVFSTQLLSFQALKNQLLSVLQVR
jgi:hypothetical protein